MEDVVAGADEDGGNPAPREARLVASAGARRFRRDTKALRDVEHPMLEVWRFIRDDERIAATPDDVEVQHRDEALDAAGRDRHLRDVRLRAVEPLLLAGECHEHDRMVERRPRRDERASDLDGHRRAGRVVVRGLEDRAVGVRTHSVEMAADQHRPRGVVRVGRAEHADDVDRVDVVDRRERHAHANGGLNVEG